MTFDPSGCSTFRYEGFSVGAGELTCRYRLGDLAFSERIRVAGDHDWSAPAALEAARIVHLLAGVSYYKAAAPPTIDLGDTPLRDGDAELLREFYVEGLGEFAFRNGLDLDGVTLTGGRPAGAPAPVESTGGRPLVPFGGGIDSIVTAEAVKATHPDAALFVLSREGDRFAAIEAAAAVTCLPVARAERRLDPAILDSAALGFRNGHVPVTGILSAVAVLTAVLGGHDAVVMSNEWSASIGTTVAGGRRVNHQYSKSLEFEEGFRAMLGRSFVPTPGYFSFLRDRSELWVARRFAGLERYHRVFRSCNRAFHVDPAARLDHWCGRCDKCCFIDLVLAPFMDAAALASVFGGREPLADPSLEERFRTLLGRSADPKPFECVGDVDECRAAADLASARSDRVSTPMLARLATGKPAGTYERLFGSLGPTHVPPAYAAPDLLV